MGLKQDFKFKYEDALEVETFIQSFSDNFVVRKFEDHYLIRDKNDSGFNLRLSVEPSGIRCDREGEYFRFVGIFVEEITGKFGELTIEDVWKPNKQINGGRSLNVG